MTIAPPAPIPAAHAVVLVAYKAAADRVLRITRDQGTVEALNALAELEPHERDYVAVLLAQAAARCTEPMPPDDTSKWWTDDELRKCHNLHVQGYRSTWVDAGHRLYMRHHQRARREAQRVAEGRPAADPARNGGRSRMAG